MFESIHETALRIATSDNVMMTLLAVPVLFVFERLWWVYRESVGHYWFGIVFFAVNAVLLGILAPFINYFTALGLQTLGFGLIDLQGLGFDGLAGSAVAVLVSTFVVDFFYYWFHRSLHRSRILWQMHLLHHSDENMNMLTAQRGHIFEGLIAPFFVTFPMAVLFRLPPVEIAVLSLVPQIYQFLAHANVRLGYGPFWWLIISPDYHRIHHSIEPRHRDKNFTNWFPVWDIVFGTLYRPQPDERPRTGVAGVRVRTIRAAYALPIRGWRDLLRQSGDARAKPAGSSDALQRARRRGTG